MKPIWKKKNVGEVFHRNTSYSEVTKKNGDKYFTDVIDEFEVLVIGKPIRLDSGDVSYCVMDMNTEFVFFVKTMKYIEVDRGDFLILNGFYGGYFWGEDKDWYRCNSVKKWVKSHE